MNPVTAAKTAAKGTEYRHAVTLKPQHCGRVIRVEGDKNIYLLREVHAFSTFVELHVTRSGVQQTMAVPHGRVIEVQP